MTITENKKLFRLIPQVMVLFVIGILLTGIITHITESTLTGISVTQQTESRTSEMAEEAVMAIMPGTAYFFSNLPILSVPNSMGAAWLLDILISLVLLFRFSDNLYFKDERTKFRDRGGLSTITIA